MRLRRLGVTLCSIAALAALTAASASATSPDPAPVGPAPDPYSAPAAARHVAKSKPVRTQAVARPPVATTRAPASVAPARAAAVRRAAPKPPRRPTPKPKPKLHPTWPDVRALWSAAVGVHVARVTETSDSQRRLLAAVALSLLALTSLTLVAGAARARR